MAVMLTTTLALALGSAAGVAPGVVGSVLLLPLLSMVTSWLSPTALVRALPALSTTVAARV